MKKKASSQKKPSKASRTSSIKNKKSRIKSKGKSISSKRSSHMRKLITGGKRRISSKAATKQTTKSIARRAKPRKRGSLLSKTVDRKLREYRIVRIMGQGQFTVDNSTLKRLSELDDSIVQLVSKDRSDDTEFRNRLTELTRIVESKGKPLDPKEIIQSDIILPSTDLSVDEAKKLFMGEGVIPETEV
jgi:PspA-Associated protein